MAEIQEQQQAGAKKPTRKKHSVRVDLTPMVDLGFILITFFIFTTSMSEPKSMKLRLPKPTITDSMQTAESKTLSLVLGGGRSVFHFTGSLEKGKSIKTNVDEARAIILKHRTNVAKLFGDPKEQVILIKPTEESSYRDLVDILDEMLINDVGRYVLMEPSEEEKLMLLGY